MSDTRKKLGQWLGVDPKTALLTFIVSIVLHLPDVARTGFQIPIALAGGAAMGFAAYRAQIGWYQDEHPVALVKGVILGVLTALPTAIPAVFYMTAGALGLIHNIRREPD